MFALKRLVLIGGSAILCVGLALAENPSTRPGKPAAHPATSSPKRTSVTAADESRPVADSPSVGIDSASPRGMPANRELIEKVSELEGRVAALQARYDALERLLGGNADILEDMQARLESLENRHGTTQAQFVRLQSTQKERQLNPTEHKQIAALIQQRVSAAQNQWTQTLRTLTAPSYWQPRHEEPLYAP